MQTFLPYADYAQSAACLDNKRLGKQRVETFQLLQVLLGERLITTEKIEKPLHKDPAKTRMVKIPVPKADWQREPLTSKGWGRHPAALMWKGHELELLAYQEAICHEWTKRGFKDSCLAKSRYLIGPHLSQLKERPPSWLGRHDFHRSHQSNLLRKDPNFYGPVFPQVADDLPYIWPKP